MRLSERNIIGITHQNHKFALRNLQLRSCFFSANTSIVIIITMIFVIIMTISLSFLSNITIFSPSVAFLLCQNLKSHLSFIVFSDETPEVSPITSPSRSHSTSSPGSSVSSSPRSYQSHHSAQNSPPSGSSHTPITHYGLPPCLAASWCILSDLVIFK